MAAQDQSPQGVGEGWTYQGPVQVSLPAAGRMEDWAAGYTGVLAAHEAVLPLRHLLADAANGGVRVRLQDAGAITRAWERLLCGAVGSPAPAYAPTARGRPANHSTPLILGRPICLVWAAETDGRLGGAPQVELWLSRSVTASLAEGHTTSTLLAVQCVRHALDAVGHLLTQSAYARSRSARPQTAQVWRLYVQQPSAVSAFQLIATRPAQAPVWRARPPRARGHLLRRTAVFGMWLLVKASRLGYRAGAASRAAAAGTAADGPHSGRRPPTSEAVG